MTAGGAWRVVLRQGFLGAGVLVVVALAAAAAAPPEDDVEAAGWGTDAAVVRPSCGGAAAAAGAEGASGADEGEEGDAEAVARRLRDAAFAGTAGGALVPHLFVCGLLPGPLYDALDRHFPPAAKLAQQPPFKRKKPGFEHARLRWKAGLTELLERLPAGSPERAAWQRAGDALLSKRVEKALLEALNVTGTKVKDRDLRVQLDKEGFSIGMHADEPRKIATLQLYLPDRATGETDAVAKAYGTCLHTVAQYGKRAEDGTGPCHSKFLFLPNSAYSFAVGPTSYHSVRTDEYLGPRRTVMLNLYRDKVKDRKVRR